VNLFNVRVPQGARAIILMRLLCHLEVYLPELFDTPSAKPLILFSLPSWRGSCFTDPAIHDHPHTAGFVAWMAW